MAPTYEGRAYHSAKLPTGRMVNDIQGSPMRLLCESWSWLGEAARLPIIGFISGSFCACTAPPLMGNLNLDRAPSAPNRWAISPFSFFAGASTICNPRPGLWRPRVDPLSTTRHSANGPPVCKLSNQGIVVRGWRPIGIEAFHNVYLHFDSLAPAGLRHSKPDMTRSSFYLLCVFPVRGNFHCCEKLRALAG